MVERLQKNIKQAVFVDLDGTLIKGNSMKLFSLHLLRLLIKRGQLYAWSKSLFWIGLRKSRLISHKRMKWHLTSMARCKLSANDWKSLVIRLAQDINPEVIDCINAYRNQGAVIYIATAAPEEYACILAENLHFAGALSTIFRPNYNEYTELRSEIKLKAIEELIIRNNLYLSLFLTDHIDDISTAKLYPRQTILVNADPKTISAFEDIGVTKIIL